MGKPFISEINDLQNTFDWGKAHDVTAISDAIRATSHLPLLSIGSGGSFSAAELHATLHRLFFGTIAQALTPMELVSNLPRDGRASVWFQSASGNNIDIRRSFKHASLLELKSISALVGSKGSKIADLASRYQYTNLFEFIPPSGKDGFLATNSLFASAILLYKAYCDATNYDASFTSSLNEFFSQKITNFENIEMLETSTKSILKKDVIHVIYSPQLKSIAVDIESKFIEAGLASIHVSDLRNFAHGRHHWFAKNDKSSGFLCLTTSDHFKLGNRTLELLPDNITKSHINFCSDHGAELLAGLVLSIYLTYWRGLYCNIDPGKPGVPRYGSKIYRLTSQSGFVKSLPKEDAIIRRKINHGPVIKTEMELWKKAYRKFLRSLSKQRFGGVVLDYDGTLVDARSRREPPSKQICNELVRLLDIGIKIGIATGRGKSIREDLRRPGIIPQKYWNQIIIGYYNGSDINILSNDDSPNRTDKCCVSLNDIVKLLGDNLLVTSLNPEITSRHKQVTVEPKTTVSETFLWESVQDQLSYYSDLSVKVVRSSHSIDIIASDVSKLAVVNKIRQEMVDGSEIITIGDRGRWPGNDVELLSTKYSLSVDEVSFAQNQCWNLCPAGVRGPQGTLGYLKRLKGKSGTVLFK